MIFCIVRTLTTAPCLNGPRWVNQQCTSNCHQIEFIAVHYCGQLIDARTVA